MPYPGTVRLAVFDVLGRQVLAREERSDGSGPNRTVLDLHALAAGAYMIRLNAGPQGAVWRGVIRR